MGGRVSRSVATVALPEGHDTPRTTTLLVGKRSSKPASDAEYAPFERGSPSVDDDKVYSLGCAEANSDELSNAGTPTQDTNTSSLSTASPRSINLMSCTPLASVISLCTGFVH